MTQIATLSASSFACPEPLRLRTISRKRKSKRSDSKWLNDTEILRLQMEQYAAHYAEERKECREMW